mmetsp:Transcript_3678/g.4201  ORF Transcript_3678/g.4201 Transcript_3678/m.4201 type:complete len:204 (+) Transcript_3678:381-992(+)
MTSRTLASSMKCKIQASMHSVHAHPRARDQAGAPGFRTVPGRILTPPPSTECTRPHSFFLPKSALSPCPILSSSAIKSGCDSSTYPWSMYGILASMRSPISPSEPNLSESLSLCAVSVVTTLPSSLSFFQASRTSPSTLPDCIALSSASDAMDAARRSATALSYAAHFSGSLRLARISCCSRNAASLAAFCSSLSLKRSKRPA